MVYRVFLSSTSQDLVAHREAVLAAIHGLDGFHPIAMENFGARAEAAVDFDDRQVREGHVLVGLLGLCYGSAPREGPPSFTKREYDSAIAGEIDRLMLVSLDDFLVPGHLIEPDGQRQRQQAFRARVKTDLVADVSDAAFASPAALASAVTRTLANWRADRENADEIVAELVATKAERDQHQARAAELERAVAEGQKEREALRAAVMALTGKAREADAPAGVEHALDLLRDGQTGEAEAIFAEVVARKEAEGTHQQAEGLTALREAAEAARHLGALAYLDDTRKAIDAYSTATRLDPDHAWSWIFLGLLHQRAGSLARAEHAFDQARAAANRTGHERDESVAQAYLGDVRMAQGNLSEARAAYEAALSVHQHTAAQDPRNTQWQRDLSVAHNKIGDVLVAQGNLRPALDSYRASLAITERLAQADPGNAGWQRDLSVSHNKIGDVLVAQGNLRPPLDSYRASLAIRERLAQADPGNAGWQRDLSVSQEKIGDVLVAQGNLGPALDSYRASLAISERLAQADPRNAGWQRDLSVSHNKIGDVLVAQGNLGPALDSYRASLAIRERLAQAGPGNAGWQRDLIVSNVKIAEIAGQANEGAKARAHYQAALEIAADLQATGRLAPSDAWMVGELEARLAALPPDTAGE